LRPVWMTNHPPSVLWHCWLGHQTCKNRRPYNLYCVGADVKPRSIIQSTEQPAAELSPDNLPSMNLVSGQGSTMRWYVTTLTLIVW